VESVKDEYWTKKITQADKAELAMLLWMAKNDVNLDIVIAEYD
jgi:hypothetical protein